MSLHERIESLHRPTWAEVSAQAIRRNAASFKERLAPGCRLMAVVKADGYGHGDRTAAAAALAGGADSLGVATLDEALRLRRAGIAAPVLVLGHVPPPSVGLAIRNGIALTAFSQETALGIAACSRESPSKASVHVKIDTGMSRLGASSAAEAAGMAALLRSAGVAVEGIYTHFACADHPDAERTETAFARFLAIVAEVERATGNIPIKHCCNTAATLRFARMHLDMARVGIGLYGLSPFGPELRGLARFFVPAMRVKSRIVSIRDVPPGQPVGYGGTFRSGDPRRIATLPIGYADGLPRALSGRGFALVRGCRVPIAGAVCMDQTMLDVSGVPEADTGDAAVLLGAAQGASLTGEEVAELADTIPYEIVTRLGGRVPRLAE